jgi:hypothetical protein
VDNVLRPRLVGQDTKMHELLKTRLSWARAWAQNSSKSPQQDFPP